jgi:hypothetical protein
VRFKWLDDELTYQLYELEGAWTWDEFYPVYHEAVAEELRVGHRVDTIVDLTRSIRLPPNAISHLKGMSDNAVPNDGLNVLVTSNRTIQVLYNVAVRVYPRIGRLFIVTGTLDEARRIVEADRQRRASSAAKPTTST